MLRRIAELVREHGDELLALQALDNSVPLSFGSVYGMSASMVADIFEHHAGWVDKLGGETLPPFQGGDHLVMTLREPVGVVGAVIPWNAPLLLFAQKAAPALAAGCTIVAKPSEYATFAVLRLARLMEEAGLPPGVLNIVTGPGEPTGDALISHPQGRQALVHRQPGGRPQDHARGRGRLQAGQPGARRQEPGADLRRRRRGDRRGADHGHRHPRAVRPGLPGPDPGPGAPRRGRGVPGVSQAIAGMVSYGNPFDPAVTAAPLINTRQLDRVLSLIEAGQAEGATLVSGGTRSEGDLAAGNFVAPTLFTDVNNDMRIAREEIFGPVLSVIPFTDEDEAVRIANDTEYGLAATVWTGNVKRALRLTKALRAGTVGINGYTLEPHAAFGGYGQSGLGREGGRTAIEAYTEVKTVFLPFTDEMM